MSTQDIPTPLRVEETFAAILKRRNLKPADVRGKERDSWHNKVRRLVVMELLEAGHTTLEIGRLLKRDHATILYYKNTAEKSGR